MVFFKQWWHGYKSYIDLVTQASEASTIRDIAYWRHKLFKNFILYCLPVSLMALLPAIPLAVNSGRYYLIAFDVLILAFTPYLALNRHLTLYLRKSLVTLLFYFFAFVTVASLGASGPGVLYMLATTVFATLILSAKMGYVSVFMHFLTSLFFSGVIQWKLFASPLIHQYSAGSWMAFCANLIFLSLICVVLISTIINGLEGTVIQEITLQEKLQREVNLKENLHQKLQESEGHYKSLFDHNPSPMWVIDGENHHFLQVNEAAIENYGYTHDEFLKMSIYDLRLATDTDRLNKSLKEKLKPGKRHHYVTKHLSKKNEIFDVEIKCSPITVERKQAILAIGRDITQQKKYTKDIEEQNQKLQEIAYIQSHVVRAPLARIMGLVSLIRHAEHERPDPVVLQHLEVATQEFDLIIHEITDHTQGMN